MNDGEQKPPHPVVLALLVLVGLAFVGWALAGYVSELIGAYW